MYNLKLSQYRRRIRGQNHFLEVINHDFVTTIGPKRGLDGLGNRPACVNVADNGSIFSVVAVVGWLAIYAVHGGVMAGLLLVALLEETGIWGVGY
jgi:hypothetical protein